jgi:hypothetical protein
MASRRCRLLSAHTTSREDVVEGVSGQDSRADSGCHHDLPLPRGCTCARPFLPQGTSRKRPPNSALAQSTLPISLSLSTAQLCYLSRTSVPLRCSVNRCHGCVLGASPTTPPSPPCAPVAVSLGRSTACARSNPTLHSTAACVSHGHARTRYYSCKHSRIDV